MGYLPWTGSEFRERKSYNLTITTQHHSLYSRRVEEPTIPGTVLKASERMGVVLKRLGEGTRRRGTWAERKGSL